MADVPTLPADGEVFLDARGEDRALRTSWHAEKGVFVISFWRFEFCIATFRLRVDDAPAFMDLLSKGLAQAPPVGPELEGGASRPMMSPPELEATSDDTR